MCFDENLQVEVLFSERQSWLEMVRTAYMTEVDEQCAAIRRGMLSAALPLPFLALTSSDSLELAVAGGLSTRNLACRASENVFTAVDAHSVAGC